VPVPAGDVIVGCEQDFPRSFEAGDGGVLVGHDGLRWVMSNGSQMCANC